MNQKRLAVALAAILLISAAIILAVSQDAGKSQNRVCFRENCFQVELALTPEQQAQGLMFRQNLDPDKGMLFIFQEEGIYPFWMKDTLIPLDMIWMDSNKTVVFIKKDAEPCGSGDCPLINPGKKAKYVLEVNAGAAERIGLQEGDEAAFFR